MRPYILLAALCIATSTFAQTIQPVKLMDPVKAGTALGTATNPVVTVPSANTSSRTTEVLVTNAAGGTVVTNAASALTARKSFAIQNNGPNRITCALGGATPVSGKAYVIPADPAVPWVINGGPNIVVTCIADTAAQVTGAATVLAEVR